MDKKSVENMGKILFTLQSMYLTLRQCLQNSKISFTLQSMYLTLRQYLQNSKFLKDIALRSSTSDFTVIGSDIWKVKVEIRLHSQVTYDRHWTGIHETKHVRRLAVKNFYKYPTND